MIIKAVFNEKSERIPLGKSQIVKHIIGFQSNLYCAGSGEVAFWHLPAYDMGRTNAVVGESSLPLSICSLQHLVLSAVPSWRHYTTLGKTSKSCCTAPITVRICNLTPLRYSIDIYLSTVQYSWLFGRVVCSVHSPRSFVRFYLQCRAIVNDERIDARFNQKCRPSDINSALWYYFCHVIRRTIRCWTFVKD